MSTYNMHSMFEAINCLKDELISSYGKEVYIPRRGVDLMWNSALRS